MISLSPGRRILIAVLAAVGLTVLLQVALTEGVEEAAAAALPEPPPTSARLPEHLRRRAALLYLVADSFRLPDTAAPAVVVRADGQIELLRSAPVPEGPEPRPWTAGIVLPAKSLAELTPIQRVALLDVCAGFSGGESLEPDRIEGLGFAFGDDELRQLLYWLR
jgi:hypothetical protein